MIAGADITRFVDSRKPWANRAEELADWTWNRLVVRTDVWGGYQPKKYREEGKQFGLTKPRKTERGKKFLSRDVLVKHFKSRSEGDVIGLHAIGQDNSCMAGAVELDRHGDGPEQPTAEQIFDYALALRKKLVDLGFRPLMIDSNGRGGIHLRILFSERVEAGPLYRFLQQLASGFAAFGFDVAPETFPKQPELSEQKQFGNWLRLPGRHHTHPHVSRVHDGADWLEGNAAIDFILSLQGDDPSLLPFIPPPETAKAHETNGHARHYQDGDADVVLRARSYLEKIEPAVSGNRGHDVTYRACCKLLHGFELSIGIAYAMMAEWNLRCSPSWSEADLRRKLEEADREPGERGYLLKDNRRPARDGKTSAPPDGEEKDSRPEIEVTPDEHLVNDQAIEALTADPTLFQRGGSLVHVIREGGLKGGILRPDDSPRIVPVESAGIRERLSKFATFVHWKETADGTELVRQHPPAFCPAAIAARGSWSGIRRLEGVTNCPLLRPDGTVIETPGYDEATGLIFEPNTSYPRIADRLSRVEVEAALEALREIIADFPFAEEAHASTWLAALLTPLARLAFSGPAPMFLVDSNIRGSGKSLLCDCIALLVTGRDAPRMSAPPDDDETRKMITAVAIGGDQLLLLDNVEGELGNASLDAALTATRWKNRILGQSAIVELPLNVVWFASGNNVALKADTSRRVAHIRLNCPLECPEEREDFRHPNLKGWALDNRGALVAAALTILRGYCIAGRPQTPLKPWGSFEGWSDLIRQAVVWAGCKDPGATRRELVKRADREANALAQLIAGLDKADPNKAGLTVAEIIHAITPDVHGNVLALDLKNAVAEICPSGPGGLPSVISLGRRLGKLRGRFVGDRAIDAHESDHQAKWYVYEVSR